MAAPVPDGLHLEQRVQLLLIEMYRWSDRRADYIRVSNPTVSGLHERDGSSEAMPLALEDIVAAHAAELTQGVDAKEAAHVLWGLVHGYGLLRLLYDDGRWTPEATARAVVLRFTAAVGRRDA
jgi:hypothetical protein